MWYEVIERTEFLQKLYNNIPDLFDVEILSIQLEENANRIRMSLFIPTIVDNPPLKWKQLKYDAALIDLDLFIISHFSLRCKSNKYIVNIYMEEREKNIVVKCEGGIDIKICAEIGMIQSVRGCRSKEIHPV